MPYMYHQHQTICYGPEICGQTLFFSRQVAPRSAGFSIIPPGGQLVSFITNFSHHMTCSRPKVEIFHLLSLSFPTAMLAKKDLALSLTEDVASYMKAKFHQQLRGSEGHVPFPPHWDFTLLQECDQAVGILLDAYRNRCKKYDSSTTEGHIESFMF